SIKIMVRDNRIVRIEGDWEGSVNHGVLCEHGRYDAVKESRKRITTPLQRKNGKLEPVSWNEALKEVASKLQPLASQKDGLAAIASTRLPAETLTAFKDLFAGSQLVTSVEEGMPTAASTQFAEKQGTFEGRLDVLRTADTVFCVGANLSRSHMVAGFMFKRNLPKGTRLISVDPEETQLDELANISIRNRPGSDLALIQGFQAIIVKEGLGRVSLAIPDPEARIDGAIRETGISLEQLTQTARALANSITPVILFGKGITAQRDQCLVEELHKLAVLIGAVDNERAGLLSIKGEANSQTAALLGLDQVLELIGQKAVYVALGDDYISKSLVERVSKAPYLVVQASYESKLTEQADVVLPVTTWAEQEGHYISLDGRIQKAEKALVAPENVRDNLAVLSELATRMNMSLETDWRQAILVRKSSVALS
ncbi:MAG TPA: molybdopterin-dependent oxidoreductase, partial [Anaerolineales bacterium]|nr:molybdopterin-dependent oxidoreductase [Anaerolineales bacterium]